MTFVRSLIIAASAIFATIACSSGGTSLPNPPAPPPLSAEVGSVSASLSPGSDTLSTVGYVLTDGTNLYTGTADISGGNGFSISPVVADSGYTLALSGTTDDGLSTCYGLSGPFLVQNQLTTNVNVNLTCSVNAIPGDGGTVSVGVGTTNCPSANPLVADSTTLLLGASTNVAASAAGPNTADLTYTWTVLSGTGSIATQDTPPSGNGNSVALFSCPATTNETDTVQVAITDGNNCTLTEQIVITCGSGNAPAPPVGSSSGGSGGGAQQ